MTATEKFDAVIVGAGVAGLACAYVLAKEGRSVLIIERGASAGSKNVTGGRVYTYALERLEPGLAEKAPLQRKVVREQIMMLGEKGGMTFDYADFGYGEAVPHSYTVLRAPFDNWLAGEAENRGAVLVKDILVEDLLEQDGRIVGIRAGDERVYAGVVVAADGVNSLLAQKAGLRADITTQAVGIGVKEVIELPRQVIESRFNLTGDEGAARMILGCSDGIAGGGFLYTNTNSLSLGMVFNSQQAVKHGRKLTEMLQDFKMHPAIAPLIEGGTSVEYGAHLVPEQGLSGIPRRIFREGLLVVGDAAGFVINTGLIIRGIDLAILSGIAAAQAIVKSDASAQTGPLYMDELEQINLMPAMRQFAGWHKIVSMPSMASVYPAMMNDIFHFLFTVDGSLPPKMPRGIRAAVQKHAPISQLLGDAWRGFRAI